MKKYFIGGLIFLVILLFVFIGLLISSREVIFEKQIKTDLSQVEVWQIFEESFTDSSQVSVWPSNEKIHSSGLRNMSEVFVTYFMFGKSKTFKYTLFDVSIGKGFKYTSSEDHPMLGVGEVQIIPQKNGSIVNWNGTFAIQRLSLTGFWAKYFFIGEFFEQFEENIKSVE
jgi:hypothetical protein